LTTQKSEPGSWQRVADAVRRCWRGFDRAQRERAVDITAFEERELENVFMLLLLGPMAGLPAPPAFVAVELLPHLEHELEVLMKRAEEAPDSLAELAGLLGME
jgi:hypothetical protein